MALHERAFVKKRTMRSKYFNFLYIPTSHAQPKPIHVRRSLVYSLAVIMAVGVGVATWAVARYSGKIKDTYKLAALERQNATMQAELSDISAELEVLGRHVTQNFDFQKKARLLANLDDISDDISEVGVGGPDQGYIKAIAHLDAKTRDRVFSARGDVDKLLRQSKLQRESYQGILTRLQETDDKMRGTPSLRPVNVGFVSSRFGWRMDPVSGRRSMHRGVDFSARLGTPVSATADGVIQFSGTWKTYGNVVEVSHGFGFVTRFAHLQKRLVRKGQRVRRGDIIGRVGSTGKSTFSHLHYEVERDGNRVDPLKFVLAR